MIDNKKSEDDFGFKIGGKSPDAHFKIDGNKPIEGKQE